jgi:hypothetical protein
LSAEKVVHIFLQPATLTAAYYGSMTDKQRLYEFVNSIGHRQFADSIDWRYCARFSSLNSLLCSTSPHTPAPEIVSRYAPQGKFAFNETGTGGVKTVSFLA